MYDRTSKITFSGPVEIPGVHLKGYAMLPAGTYLATIMAIPNTRLKLSDKTVITFRERPNGEPPALRVWFYPDAQWGDEFVYGKKKAKEIVQATQTPVLYNNSDTNENAEVTEPIQAPKPAEVQQMNQAVTPPTPTQAQLPQTGSPFGWIMLSGLLSLAGGLGVKMLRQTCS